MVNANASVKSIVCGKRVYNLNHGTCICKYSKY